VPWFTRDGRDKVPADQIAQSLFQVMVEEEPEPAHPKQYDLPRAFWPQFRGKMRLYREAIVLNLLLSQAQKDKRYEEVLKSYERLIFPSTPSPEGMVKLEALKHAMERISELIDPGGERKPLSWSMAWLADIGHEATNPVTLTLFATYWMDTYIAVAKSLADLRPS
jgi:hypothetical protein